MFRYFTAGALAAALVVSAGLAGTAQDPKPKAAKQKALKKEHFSINDPEKLKADRDYVVQGEYEGTVATAAGQKVFGAQVVAKGKGEFDVRLLSGGLPGHGWDGMTQQKGTAKRDDAGAVAISGEFTGAIADDRLTFPGGTLGKVGRKSPTLNQAPPVGANVLYASSADLLPKWDGAKVVELSDGKFLGVGGRSKDKFQSFQLHIEFRIPWMPDSTGQARGNSGVYLIDRYEVQILDSFGLKGLDNECGGIYKESAPKVNMCLPPMTWQTYDIDFTAAQFGPDGNKTSNSKATIKHNGVVIHDGLELKSNTPGGKFNKEVPEPGSLYLQNHGDPVVFDNIWVVAK